MNNGETPATNDRLDGRRSNVKRQRTLVALYTDRLGGSPDPVKAAQIQRAADLSVIADDLRKAFMRGDAGVTADAIVRADNAADRARRSLGLHGAPERTVRPIRERLRQEVLPAA